MTHPIIPDVSFYQYSPKGDPLRIIDFEKMRAAPSAGVIIRAGQNLWVDPRFDLSWTNSKCLMPRGSYWFYDSRAKPKDQARLWTQLLDSYGDFGEMEMWPDFEDIYQGTYKGMKNYYDFVEYIRYFAPNKKIGIYTGYYYWMGARGTNAQFDEYFSQFPLWIASYNNVGPKLPKPWVTWDFWQYTDNGNGRYYGVVSEEIDLNQFHGTQEEFDLRYGKPAHSPVTFSQSFRLVNGKTQKMKEV